MTRRFKLALLFLAPIALFAALVGVDRAFGDAPGRSRDYVVRMVLPPAGGELGLPQVFGPADASRPLVVIDPGHGGHDPGASIGSLKEKALTLGLAEALRDRLIEQGGVRVALTRDADHYLLLTERTGIARRLHADLFVSIHADSSEAGNGRGATVYTLSDRGTSEVAQRLAIRENRADQINGLRLTETSDAVSAILVDLSQRDSQARSEEFARLLLREGQGKVAFHDKFVQSAAFAVLKSPDMPSVLFESGYINNPDDAERLASRQGRAQFAEFTAKAIRAYFARHSGP